MLLLSLVIKCMVVFQVSLNFDAVKKTMSYLYFNEEKDYSEENTCGNDVFHTTNLHH